MVDQQAKKEDLATEVIQATWVEVTRSAGLWEVEVAARPTVGRA